MAQASFREAGAGFRIRAADVPLLPGLAEYIAAGYLTRGTARNPEHYGHLVRFADDVPATLRSALWEVETSGGLLLAIPPEQFEAFKARAAQTGHSRLRCQASLSGLDSTFPQWGHL